MSGFDDLVPTVHGAPEASPQGKPADRGGEDASGRLAAVDLGSNSFHMLVANLLDGEPVVVDQIREQVQLGAGLDEDHNLDSKTQKRALDCLKRFGQRVRELPAARVRAVGTNTLRAARNARDFLGAAEEALGHPIEIISGREEARLIYLGVAHSLSDDAGYRLVVDIGGGSTECILGERFEALEVHSLYMGCVTHTKRFFPGGKITREGMDKATLAARLELQTVQRRFRDIGWGDAVGASGTIRAVNSVIAAQGWGEGGITRESLRRVRKALVAAGDVRSLKLDGLKTERAPVFAGGVAILRAVFSALKIERMQVSSGALREGVMYDLLGRIRHEDVRERTIHMFQQRYHVDLAQAVRVRRTALALFKQVADKWDLSGHEAERFLAWAGQLHEVGLAMSYEHYHRHGAYIVANSDLPGFSRDDQQLLALLVAGHRRKLKLLSLEALPEGRRELARRLMALLRLAVMLNRGRSPNPRPIVGVTVTKKGLRLMLPTEWLDEHPLTRLDLKAETSHLRVLGLELEVEETDAPSG